MAGRKRSAAEQARDRRKIAEFYLDQKLTQDEIAERLNLSQATVSRDLEKIIAADDYARRQTVDHWRERTIADLAWVKEQARDAWEASRLRAISAKGTIVEVPGHLTDDGQFMPQFLLPGERGFLDVYGENAMRQWKVMGFEKLAFGASDDQEINIQITVAPVAPRPKPGGDGQSATS